MKDTIYQQDSLLKDYIDIIESLNYLPPDTTFAQVKDIVNTKMKRIL